MRGRERGSMAILRSVVLAAVALALSGQAAPAKYEAGQVWAYRTRPQDAGSLLKIQQVGDFGGSKVYHLSIVGVQFANRQIAGTLPHIPVSEATLDASVTQRASAQANFPTKALQDGIAEWETAKGGVFTIPVAQIIDIIDQQVGARAATERSPTTS